MSLLRVARTPATAVDPGTKVIDAVRTMERENVSAVAVTAGDRLIGMFSQRDVMVRVVLERRDPETTEVKDVMTTSVVTIASGAKPDDAVATMCERHIGHLPVVAIDGAVEGILESASLFYERLEDLNREIDSLHAYYAADALGG